MWIWWLILEDRGREKLILHILSGAVWAVCARVCWSETVRGAPLSRTLSLVRVAGLWGRRECGQSVFIVRARGNASDQPE